MRVFPLLLQCKEEGRQTPGRFEALQTGVESLEPLQVVAPLVVQGDIQTADLILPTDP